MRSTAEGDGARKEEQENSWPDAGVGTCPGTLPSAPSPLVQDGSCSSMSATEKLGSRIMKQYR